MGNAFAYLVDTLAGLYAAALLLRFLLQAVRANFYNPVARALVQVTDPVLRPLRRVIPGVGGLDAAALVAMYAVVFVGAWAVTRIAGVAAGAPALALAALYQALDLVLFVYIVTIVLEALMSWLNPGVHNPVRSALYQLNEPVLRPARRVLPPVGGLDLSPLVVLIALQFMRLLLRQLF